MASIETSPSRKLSPPEANSSSLNLIRELEVALTKNLGIADLSQNRIHVTHNGEQMDFSHRFIPETGEVTWGISYYGSRNHVFLTGFETSRRNNLKNAEIRTTTTKRNTSEAVDFAASVIDFLKNPAR